MANVRAVLIGEYLVALGFSSWAALKSQQAPWPPTVIKTGVAFTALGLLSFASAELASMLGAGFLLAQLIRVMNNKDPYTGGVPTNIQFDLYGRPLANMPKNVRTEAREIISWKRPG